MSVLRWVQDSQCAYGWGSELCMTVYGSISMAPYVCVPVFSVLVSVGVSVGTCGGLCLSDFSCPKTCHSSTVCVYVSVCL